MFSRYLIIAAITALLAGLVGQATAQASERIFYLNSYSQTTFYDLEGNTLGLQLDVENRNSGTVVIGTMVTLNGVRMGYAPPVVQSNGTVIFWDARGAHVTLVNGQYVVRLADLGPWYSEKIGPVNTNPSQPPVQTSR